MTEEFNWASNLNSATINTRKAEQGKAMDEFVKHLEQEIKDNPNLLDEIKDRVHRCNGDIQTQSTEFGLQAG